MDPFQHHPHAHAHSQSHAHAHAAHQHALAQAQQIAAGVPPQIIAAAAGPPQGQHTHPLFAASSPAAAASPVSSVGGLTSSASSGKSKLESWSATLAGGGKGVMRAAAGGLTLRRGDSAQASSGPSKMLSIAVVGLSGGEKEKGSMGVGKSCLCNRFIQPLADDYSVDHISVFSQSDFSGRVVNNDHFLYWGEIKRTNEEGTDFQIQVVEQTEFYDDASFQPFRASGKSEPYPKRCSSTKLVSAEKLMYICKDQLGIEREYEQRLMPDGRFPVDGFVVTFDVSHVPNRSAERQVDVCANILNNIIKLSKKPVVIAATKCDEADEQLVHELERLVNRKEFKGLNIPVVETSSHENINVDTAFFAVAQLADKTRGRSRIASYMESAHMRRELLDMTTENYVRMLRTHVQDYGVLWSTAFKKLSQYEGYGSYCDIFGKDSAQRLFRRHVKKLKEEYLGEKVQRYFDLLPEVLHEMFPEFEALGEGDWSLVKDRVRSHPNFDHFFVDYPEDTTWMEADLFEGDSSLENRIPYDILEMPDAETVFKNHLNHLHAHQKMMELRQDFKKMLEEMGCVTPGKALTELKVLFLGRECFENLPENQIVEIYELHQRELVVRSKKNFQELLLERSDIFDQYRSSPAGTVTQDDILDITDQLQEDSRWKALDRLDADRKLLLFQHLGFVHYPMREHCPAFPHCTDSLVERIVAKKAQGRPPSWAGRAAAASGPGGGPESSHLNLVVLGVDELGHDLADAVRDLCSDDEFEHQNQVFSLDYRTISGDVSLPENAFRTQDFLPHGCFCTFSNGPSFEYIRTSLEQTLLSNLEQEDRLPFQGLPLVLVFAPEEDLPEKEFLDLKEEGEALANSLQCPFIDVCHDNLHVGGGSGGGGGGGAERKNKPLTDGKQAFKENLVEEALRALIESIRHRSGLLNIYKATPNNAEPDIRIIMCLLCGDPYSVENVLGPLMKHQNSYLSGDRSIAIETQLGDTKRKVEVILSSYHSANDFQNELIHGFILVYSTKRKASLATLGTFSMNIPELPIQLLAVTENNGVVGAGYSDLEAVLLNEGNNVADRLNAHFMTSTSTIQQKSSFYTPFFKEVFEKKSEIEQAVSMYDPARSLEDSGEGTLERPEHETQQARHAHPQQPGANNGKRPRPPPRVDSYRVGSTSSAGSQQGGAVGGARGIPPSAGRGRGGSHHHRSHHGSRSGSGSEIYERLGEEEDIGADTDEDSDVYNSMDRGQNGGAAGSGERLVKPSQIKSKKKQGTEGGLPAFPPGRPAYLNKAATPSPPAYARVSKHDDGTPSSRERGLRAEDKQSRFRDQRAQSSGPGYGGAKRPPLPSRSFAADSPASTFFTNKGMDPPSPSQSSPYAPGTPPEPAPPDPSSHRPRPQQQPRGSDGSRLVKASTMPTGSHTSLDEATACWVDDSIFIRRSGQDEELSSSAAAANAGAFTTGRSSRGRPSGAQQPSGPPPPVKPRSQLPGKLNLSDFQKVTSALSTMQVDPPQSSPGGSVPTPGKRLGAPLAASEDFDQHGYAVPRDNMGRQLAGPPGSEYAQPMVTPPAGERARSSSSHHHQNKSHRERREQIALQQAEDSDSDSESSSDDAGGGHRSGGSRSKSSSSSGAARRHRKKPQPPRAPGGVAVATPKVPTLPVRPAQPVVPPPDRISPPDIEKAKFEEQLLESGVLGSPAALAGGKNEKELEKAKRKLDKELKQRQKDAERRKVKDEKKRLKEEKEKRDEEAKQKKKEAKNKLKGTSIQITATLEEFRTSAENPIPVFLEKAITYIEKEGLDAEGLYRVPGNRAHVDLLFLKFDEDHLVDIDLLDIAVNAVATAVKDFFFKRLPPILGDDHMSELEAISMLPDRSIKILELGKLLKRLPKTNFAVMKFIFQHFVRVTELSKENCMDSKNLAICWWPTLLQYEFGDLGKFEAMRPHLEDIVQTMIDQFRFLFCGQEEVMMV